MISVTGRVIRSLRSGALSEGSHRVEWDGRDDLGHAVSSGIYFFVLRVDGEVGSVEKVALLR